MLVVALGAAVAGFVQGLSAGGGMVVSRAVIRDLFEPAQAQKVMSQVTIYFGIAPAIAPIVGGFLLGHASWHGIFWFLALMGVLIGLANWKMLPETLHPKDKQPFSVRHLMRGYRELGLSPHFLLLCVASAVPRPLVPHRSSAQRLPATMPAPGPLIVKRLSA